MFRHSMNNNGHHDPNQSLSTLVHKSNASLFTSSISKVNTHTAQANKNIAQISTSRAYAGSLNTVKSNQPQFSTVSLSRGGERAQLMMQAQNPSFQGLQMSSQKSQQNTYSASSKVANNYKYGKKVEAINSSGVLRSSFTMSTPTILNQRFGGGSFPQMNSGYGAQRSKVVMRALPEHSNGEEDFQITYPGDEIPSSPYTDLRERDACGVGFIANLKGIKSHDVLQKSIQALNCNEHRGGCNYDGLTGDGAGLMTQIPWEIFEKWAKDENKSFDKEKTIVGTMFLSQSRYEKAIDSINGFLKDSDFVLVGWREIPTDKNVLGQMAADAKPALYHLIIQAKDSINTEILESKAYLFRKKLQMHLDSIFGKASCSITSFSNQTIVYKGMVLSELLPKFYKDLNNPEFLTQFSIYHRRFSTNTKPRWSLAQPMKFIGHNGEINTYLGNLNWAQAREQVYESPVYKEELKEILPIIDTTGSDSFALDQMIELLVHNGYSPFKAMMMLVPEAYNNQPNLDDKQEIIDFYEYYAGMQEPWDGPANLTFSDGNIVGASLDRNGLRPARFELTDDGFIYFGSEVGSNILPQGNVIEKGRLGPGQMFAIDLKTGERLYNYDIKQKIASEHPYGEWLKQYRVEIDVSKNYLEETQYEAGEALQMQTAFGITEEDVKVIIETMADEGKEATFSMGEDTPLAFISQKPRVLYDYFKQRFAQVTNPPIDPLREGLVMSLDSVIGKKGNILQPKAEEARQIKLDSPVLNESNLEEIRSMEEFKPKEISLLFGSEDVMSEQIKLICDHAVDAVKSGSEIIIISDKGLTEKNIYIPPTIATGAIHHRLIDEGLRSKASIVVETAQCWSTHHFAVLIGYGASAICPYLTFETIRQNQGKQKKDRELTMLQRQMNYQKSIEAGILKILSKIGISCLSSYQGAQIFEIIGLADEVVESAFKGSISRVGGMNYQDLQKEIVQIHEGGYNETLKKLIAAGFLRQKKDGEYHFNNTEAVKFLHKAIYDKDYDHYQLYEDHLSQRPPVSLRDLLEFNSKREPVSIDEVESVEEICKRFCTGGMSLGALSPEAHETLAIGMNRLGGKSNSGEGGEDKKRFKKITDADENGLSETFSYLTGLKNGDDANSKIKQVSSGRFGVTAEYLQSAEQIEIKVAQGAKPGEGGQLPGIKINDYIAGLRYSKPGVTLISPPPHHDIYSIEDLAQLIYDLHEVNTRAQVSVKLVAEVGIGTVASGVAKANADIIQISGHEGGTAASPISSMKHAGGLWELGLVEVHQSLQENQLREKVTLRVDGGLRGGWELVMAAILGADEFGFGSIAMIAEGCVMARVCHLNSCPVGVATQRDDLRARFKGTPENVVDFFFFMAQEVREILAKLGYRSIDEIIGQTKILKQKDNLVLNKASALDLSFILDHDETFQNQEFLKLRETSAHSNGWVLDSEIVDDKAFQAVMEKPGKYQKELIINNPNRSVCARVAGTVADKFGDKGFQEQGGELNLDFVGSGGQSFGAFIIPSMNVTLRGQSNDYVGKSMCGGNLIIKPDDAFKAKSDQNAIIGNTCFYGATGGNAYISGRAGERLGVRNSGAKIVTEGSGDHCCEYMTGGRTVVLGRVGRNVGAGMTGGLAYIYDYSKNFEDKVNKDVRVQRLETNTAATELRELIEGHYDATGSKIAEKILNNFDELKQHFWQVIPPSEDKTEFTHLAEEKSLAEATAVIDDLFETVSSSSKDESKKIDFAKQQK